jgi:hypothetical protein
MGRQMINERLVTNRIDVSKLAAGVYTLLLINGNNTISQRFVKSH